MVSSISGILNSSKLKLSALKLSELKLLELKVLDSEVARVSLSEYSFISGFSLVFSKQETRLRHKTTKPVIENINLTE